MLSLRNSDATFSYKQIDLPKLKELLNSVSCKETCPAPSLDKKAFLAHQFLVDNTFISDTKAIVSFGSGKSQHTWEDFQETINEVINPLILAPKMQIFMVEDSEHPGKKEKLPVMFGEEFVR